MKTLHRASIRHAQTGLRSDQPSLQDCPRRKERPAAAFCEAVCRTGSKRCDGKFVKGVIFSVTPSLNNPSRLSSHALSIPGYHRISSRMTRLVRILCYGGERRVPGEQEPRKKKHANSQKNEGLHRHQPPPPARFGPRFKIGSHHTFAAPSSAPPSAFFHPSPPHHFESYRTLAVFFFTHPRLRCTKQG